MKRSGINGLAGVTFARLVFTNLSDVLEEIEELSTLPRLRLGAAPVCLTFADLQEFAFPRLRLRATFAHLALADVQDSDEDREGLSGFPRFRLGLLICLLGGSLMVAAHLRASVEESAHFFFLRTTLVVR